MSSGSAKRSVAASRFLISHPIQYRISRLKQLGISVSLVYGNDRFGSRAGCKVTCTPGSVSRQRKRVGDRRYRAYVRLNTYVRTAEAWLYLCVVVDFYRKRVAGWSMSRTQNRELVLEVVFMVLHQREATNEPVILHSDRGT